EAAQASAQGLPHLQGGGRAGPRDPRRDAGPRGARRSQRDLRALPRRVCAPQLARSRGDRAPALSRAQLRGDRDGARHPDRHRDVATVLRPQETQGATRALPLSASSTRWFMDEHEQYQILMMGFLDEELSPEDERRFKEHAYGCAACGVELTKYQRLADI